MFRVITILVLALAAAGTPSHWCSISVVGGESVNVPCNPTQWPAQAGGPRPKDADVITSRTRAILAAFEETEATKAAAFYKDVVLARVEEHLAALPSLLASGELTRPERASELCIKWPSNATYTMRKKVREIVREAGFWFDPETLNEHDLDIVWPQ